VRDRADCSQTSSRRAPTISLPPTAGARTSRARPLSRRPSPSPSSELPVVAVGVVGTVVLARPVPGSSATPSCSNGRSCRGSGLCRFPRSSRWSVVLRRLRPTIGRASRCLLSCCGCTTPVALRGKPKGRAPRHPGRDSPGDACRWNRGERRKDVHWSTLADHCRTTICPSGSTLSTAQAPGGREATFLRPTQGAGRGGASARSSDDALHLRG